MNSPTEKFTCLQVIELKPEIIQKLKWGVRVRIPVESIDPGDLVVALDGDHLITKVETFQGAIRMGYRLTFKVRDRVWTQIYYSGRTLPIKKGIVVP